MFSKPMTTPNNTLIWVTIKKASQIVRIKLTAWAVYLKADSVIGPRRGGTTGKKPTPDPFVYKNLSKN